MHYSNPIALGLTQLDDFARANPVVGKEAGQDLSSDDLRNFPGKNLKMIDRLWGT
jgi:hypothetical protein